MTIKGETEIQQSCQGKRGYLRGTTDFLSPDRTRGSIDNRFWKKNLCFRSNLNKAVV